MFKRISIIILVGLFFWQGLSLVFAQPEIGKEIRKPGQEAAEKPAQRVTIQDNPVIKEFSINPSFWLAGQSGNAIFRWRVEPTPGGTNITRVTITKTDGTGPRVSVSSSNSSGQYTLSIPSSIREGRSVYALTAVNQAGNTSTSTLNFEVTTLDALREQISITYFSSSPAEIPGDSSSFDYIVRINNRSQVTVSGVDLLISWSIPFGGMGEEALSDQIIRPGNNEYRIRSHHKLHSWMIPYINVVYKDGESVANARGKVEVTRTVYYFRLKLE